MTEHSDNMPNLIDAARRARFPRRLVTDLLHTLTALDIPASISPKEFAAVTHVWRLLIKEIKDARPDAEWTDFRIAEAAALAFCCGQLVAKEGFVLPSLKEAGP